MDQQQKEFMLHMEQQNWDLARFIEKSIKVVISQVPQLVQGFF